MIRSYEDRPLAPEVVDRIVANGLRAPSGGFSQGWGFLVLQDASDRQRFWDTAGEQEWLGRNPSMRLAPLLVVALSHKDTYLDRYATAEKGWTDRDEARWPVPYWDIDTGMAALLMLLTAVDAGLGACFFAILPERFDAFRTAFAVPAGYSPVGVVSVGYRSPDTPPQPVDMVTERRPVEDVVHHGRW